MVTTTLLLLLALFCALMLLEGLIRYPVLAAGLTLGIFVLITFLDSARPEPNIGGFTVVPEDVLFGLLLLAAIARYLRHARLTPAHVGLALLTVLVLISIARGIGSYGLQQTVNESRTFLYFVGGALYFSSVGNDVNTVDRIGRYWKHAAVALIVVSVLRWIALLGALPALPILVRVEEPGTLRVIDAFATVVVAQAIFFVVPRWLRGVATLSDKVLAAAAFLCVLLLAHRTIWIVVVIAAALLVIRMAGLTRNANVLLVVGVIVGCGVLIALGSNSRSTEQVQAPLDADSLQWRFAGWVELLRDKPDNFVDVLVGRPFGSGYERRVQGVAIDVSPHNFYLQTYLRLGIVGLITLVPTLVWAALRLRRGSWDSDRLMSSEVMLTVVTMLCIYMLTWTPTLPQAIIYGLGVAVADRARPPGSVAVTKRSEVLR